MSMLTFRRGGWKVAGEILVFLLTLAVEKMSRHKRRVDVFWMVLGMCNIWLIFESW